MKQRTRTIPNLLLRQQREKQNWTQTEVARLLGTTYLSVCRWENGTTSPSLYYRKRLCELFQLSPEELGLALPSVKTTTTETTTSGDPQHPSHSDVWNVPYRRNPFFTGRDYLLARLHALLTSSRVAALSQVQAISGLGGIGKTQIVLEYAYRHRRDYRAVFWMRAENRDVLHTDLASVATLLGLVEQNEQDVNSAMTAVRHWLSTHADWLLILDNVENLALVDEVTPLDVHGHVLLTMRSQSTGTVARRLEVEQMNQDEGAFFLLRRAKLLSPDAPLEAASSTIVQQARDMCEMLGGLPLALDQAGAYIEETGCSLLDYLAYYQEHRANLLRQRGQRSGEHPASVNTTLALSIEKVAQTNPAAIDLLRICAFLAPDAIPEEIFTSGASELGPLLAPIAADPFALNMAFAALRTYSLLRRSPDSKMLTIHRLVQALLKDSMDEQRQWAERSVRAVRRTFPERDIDFWQASWRLLPQAQECVALITQWQMTFLEAGQLLGLTGHYLIEQGQYQEAKPLLEQALLLTEQCVGPEQPESAICLNRLGELYWHEEDFDLAASFRERALEIWERALGPEHPDVAHGLDGLALVYRSQARSELAEALFVRSYAIYERLAEAGSLSQDLLDDMVSCTQNLAILYTEQGRFAQAGPLLLQSITLSQQIWGAQHPMTSYAYHNLGYLYEWQGQYERAETLYRQALTVREEKLGSEHANTAATLHNIARVYQKQGNYTLAETLFQRALAVREKILGPDHARVAHTLSQMGSLYCDQGKYLQAEPLLLQALAIREQALGPEHPEVAWDLEALAQVYAGLERYSEAEPLVQRALVMYEQQLGADHLDSVESLIIAGILCYKQDRYMEAEQFLGRAQTICERLLGTEHPKTATAQYKLAELYLLQQRYTEARDLLQHVLAVREQQLGATHPDTVAADALLLVILKAIADA